MRLLPAQIDMYNLAGEWLPFCELDELPLTERLRGARQALVGNTGADFGYDLRKWHAYLEEHHKDEYCWDNVHTSILKRIDEAELDANWQKAVASLTRTS